MSEPSITVSFPAGYMGQCARCSADATVKTYCKFDTPIPATLNPDGTELFPAVEGVFHFVCAVHAADNA